mgnify:CR=1 FL=1
MLPGQLLLTGESLSHHPFYLRSEGEGGGRPKVAPTLRVYLKTPNVTGSEEFSRCARHFFAGILTYFKEK